MSELLFWFSAALIVYVYAGYPLLLTALLPFFRRPVKKAPVRPKISLLVAAYNEVDVIEAKIKNALELEYPSDQLEIIIASDGSTDGTVERARATVEKLGAGERVRVLAHTHNRGKISVLNDSVPQLTGDIVAFSDASSMLARDALRQLAEHFADPRVGAVSGVYKVRKKDQAKLGSQEDFYWRYETFLKVQEAELGSILGCHGSLYAIRRKLYPFPPQGSINDDYIIPVRILQNGYRVSYEPRSVACEEALEMDGFSRRVRIMSGNVQQLREIGPLLKPLQPLALFFFLSHKVGRLLVPPAMLALVVTNALLLPRPLFVAIGAFHGLFYGLVCVGALTALRPRFLRLPYYFCLINAAVFVAIYYAVSSKRVLAWKERGAR